MSELLSNAQMAEADRLTIEGGTQGFDLMRRAGEGAATCILEEYEDQPCLVACGPGNNGGDGFVIARHLADAGWPVEVACLVDPDQLEGEALQACKMWGGPVLSLEAACRSGAELFIDALFGTGLSRTLEPPVTDLLDHVRESGMGVIGIDVPSGVMGDDGTVDPATPEAEMTITFARKKLGHCLMPGTAMCGAVHIVDIGIEDDAIWQAGFTAYENAPELWLANWSWPDHATHKYKRGHLMIYGGKTMTGAARLAANAAARVGAGLCTISAPGESGIIYRSTCPAHILVEDRQDMAAFTDQCADERRNCALVGPGAGLDAPETMRDMIAGLAGMGKSLVLDADALTAFADRADLLAELAGQAPVVLTPHEGEFARLFPDLCDAPRLNRACRAAERTGAVIVLKGADTIIAGPQNPPAINVSGTPWLATAGTGDVLSGMIAGLVSQGMSGADAACAAVWMHGYLGQEGGAGLVASDLAEYIPPLLEELLLRAAQG